MRVASVLIAFPNILSVIFSILWLLPVVWSVKKIIVLKSNGFAKLASKLAFIIPLSKEVTFNLSPVLKVWFGRKIEFGIDESIVPVLVNPVTMLLEVLPIPTDLLYAIPSIVINEASKNWTVLCFYFLIFVLYQR